MWRIIQKDLILLLRDRRALSTLLLMPLVFIAILGLSAGQVFGRSDRDDLIGIAVADLDGGELARDLVAALAQRGGIRVSRADDEGVAWRMVNDGHDAAAVIIGTAFSQRVEALTPVDLLDTKHGLLATGTEALDIRVRGRMTLAVKETLVRDLVFAESLRLIAPAVLRRNPITARLLEAEEIGDAKGPSGGGGSPATQSTTQSAEPPEPPIYGNVVFQVIVPSYTVMFMFFLINIMARSFLAERETGTLARLRAAPLSPAAVVAGKTFPFLAISLVQGLLLFVSGRLLFGMSWGPTPWMLIPVTAATAAAATALGLLVAVLVRTDSQVTAYGNLLVITLAGISGCFFPREWMPEVMRQTSLVTPHAWALIGYEQLLTRQTPDLVRVMLCCGVLALFAGVFALLGFARFRRMR
jgi:ABC-2 type transport system permease protein